MVAWVQDSSSRDDVIAQLSGTAGINSFPNAAVPANGVSMAEVLRQVFASLQGTAAGENGIGTWPSAAAPGNSVSLAEVQRELYDQMEKAVTTSAAIIANAGTLFTIAGGPILITHLISVCVTANDTTASTLKYTATPTAPGVAVDLCAASASLASAAIGTVINITGTLANAAVVTTNGAAIAQAGAIIAPVGLIKSVVAVGSTTGTWTHHLRYRPLARGVTVS